GQFPYRTSLVPPDVEDSLNKLPLSGGRAIHEITREEAASRACDDRTLTSSIEARKTNSVN
ncbi:MAG: hypothetical protein ACYTHJ_07605, partial [Planctomycetota bacterium]